MSKNLARLTSLLSVFLFPGLQAVAQDSASSQAQNELAELAAWDYAVTSGEVSEIQKFIKAFPDGRYSSDAITFLNSFSSVETLDLEIPSEITDSSQALSTTEDTIVFDQAMVADANGNLTSLDELLLGSSLHTPFDELPDSEWKEQSCASCHAWDKATLCTQGEFYVQHGDEAVNRLEHPYGGFFKQAVQDWANAGCN